MGENDAFKNCVELKGKWQIEADEEKGPGHERS